MINATSLSLLSKPLDSKIKEERIIETKDNNLILTYNGGRLPLVKYSFDRVKLRQHLRMHALSKKIEK